MAAQSLILPKTQEARLDQLYQTKCDEVGFLDVYRDRMVL